MKPSELPRLNVNQDEELNRFAAVLVDYRFRGMSAEL